MRDFSFIGLFNGAPDLSERSEKIPREEFAKPAARRFARFTRFAGAAPACEAAG